MNVRKFLYCLCSIPKTLYFNLSSFHFNEAIKMPFFIGFNVRIIETHKGIITFPNGIKPFMVRFGVGGSPSIPSQRSSIRLRGGSLRIMGSAYFGEGSVLHLKGKLTIGEHFSANKNCFLSCTNEVRIGDKVLLGWDCHIFDDNGGHTVIYDKQKNGISVKDPAINIGNHVWLCSYSHILAGGGISDDSILAYRSLLTKFVEETNVLIAGSPASIKATNVSWNV